MMIRHQLHMLIVLATLLVSTAQADDPNQEPVLERVRRIVGGKMRSIENAPFMVNIRRNGRFHCGGSLLTRDCVLTAAHCARDAEPEDFAVRAGVTFLNQRLESRNVEDIFIPSTFNPSILDNDVAIFKLRSPLKETATGIRTIQMREAAVEPGEVVEVFGWGLPHEDAQDPSYQLKSVLLRVMERGKCNEKYKDFRNVTSSMFCTKVSPVRDACSADSGGPAVVNGSVVGVVSWGRGRDCGRARSPGVYVNVAKLRPWIVAILKKHCL